MSIQAVVDRWITDPAFRAHLQSDPEGTIRESGIVLDGDELAAVRHVNWSLSDQELAARITKNDPGSTC